jgi:glycosyltransferase involved in cell wall biosynthesis
MKILLAAPTYLPSRRANTLQVLKMAQAAKLCGHDVFVLVPNPGEKEIPDWDSLALHYGLHQKFDIEWIPIKPNLRGYDYGIKVSRYFRRLGADILYTRLPQAAAYASSSNVPTIFEVHDLPGGIMGPWLFRRFMKGKGAVRLVIITKSLKSAIIQKIMPIPDFPSAVVEPDGVDLIRFKGVPNPMDARKSLRSGKYPQIAVSNFTAGYTGNFYPGRGIDIILEMAAGSPDINFLLAGGDPQTVSDFQDKINRRGITNIILTGFIPNSDLPCFQAACDVLLMPYQSEVAASSGGDIAKYLSPLKLFEYMACSRVILSSNLPVLKEVLNERNAILLPPDDVQTWVVALQDIKNDPNRRVSLAEQSRKDSLKYSWEARADRILNI